LLNHITREKANCIRRFNPNRIARKNHHDTEKNGKLIYNKSSHRIGVEIAIIKCVREPDGESREESP
jgi:hypothetical protein